MAVSLVAYGGGTDSTALLIEMVRRGEAAPHAILFADTGGEKPHTYAHLDVFSGWLVERGYPAITVVRAGLETLEGMCLRVGVLPALAYGWKTCSQRYKVEPQEKWANNDAACRLAWSRGELVTRLIGYEYGEERRMRAADAKYANRYPLIEWEFDRAACREIIRGAGLAVPGKSSCFFCPATTKGEIRRLGEAYPDLLARAFALEAAARASGKSSSVVGLGRRFAWQDYLAGAEASPELPFDLPCGCYE